MPALLGDDETGFLFMQIRKINLTQVVRYISKQGVWVVFSALFPANLLIANNLIAKNPLLLR